MPLERSPGETSRARRSPGLRRRGRKRHHRAQSRRGPQAPLVVLSRLTAHDARPASARPSVEDTHRSRDERLHRSLTVLCYCRQDFSEYGAAHLLRYPKPGMARLVIRLIPRRGVEYVRLRRGPPHAHGFLEHRQRTRRLHRRGTPQQGLQRPSSEGRSGADTVLSPSLADLHAPRLSN